jgi:hypothetical protein
MDLFGFAAMGLVSDLGGGIIRDVLLEHGTPAALVDPSESRRLLARLAPAHGPRLAAEQGAPARRETAAAG